MLTQGVEGSAVIGQDNVITLGICGEETVDAFGGEALVADDVLQNLLGIIIEFGGNLSGFLVFGFERFGLPVPYAT